MANTVCSGIIATLFFTSSLVAANGNATLNSTASVTTDIANITVTSVPSSVASNVSSSSSTRITTSTTSTTTSTTIGTNSSNTSYATIASHGPTNNTDGNSTEMIVSTATSVLRNNTLSDDNATVTVQVTSMETSTRQTTTFSNSENTTAPAPLSIVDQVKTKWEQVVAESNFNDTVLNETSIKTLSPSDVIDIIIDLYSTANESELQSFLESEGVDELAKLLLDNTTVLENSILNEFNESSNASIHGFLASLYYLNAEVLDVGTIHALAVAYEQELSSKTGNNTENTTSSELVSVSGFVTFILSNATAEDLANALCGVVVEENLDSIICNPTTTLAPTAQPIPGPEVFQSTWSDIASSNYNFLSQNQTAELQALTPENMTSGLIDYVNGLDSSEIENLVDANVTTYVSSLLRRDGDAASILGQETVDALGGSTDKEDLYYLYLNFLNNLYSREGQFERVLQGYVTASLSSIARSTSTCDTSSITARGLCCYTITTEAQNRSALGDAVCDELEGGDECRISFNINDDDEEEAVTTHPVPSSSLSTGAIVGIVVGGIAAIVIIIIIIFFLWKRSNKKKSKVNPQDETHDSENMEMDGRTSSGSRPRGPSSRNGHAHSPNSSLSD